MCDNLLYSGKCQACYIDFNLAMFTGITLVLLSFCYIYITM
jgi:hypothetical protein